MPTTLRRPVQSEARPAESDLPTFGTRAAFGADRWPRRSWRVPPRIHAFEFCDQSWFSGVWREAYLDGLNFLFRLGGVYARMHEPFARWALQAGHGRVLDLASGGAGPIATMIASERDDGTPFPHVTLSDLYPDQEAFRRLKAAYPRLVDFISDPVEAAAGANPFRNAPLRSICSGFHHLRPDQARQLLAATTEFGDGLFVMEPMPCSWFSPLWSLPNLLVLTAAPFFARRFSLKKLAITTLLPLIPLVIVFDGVVSALRMYRPEEVLELVPEHARRSWRWAWGTQRYLGFYKATYLFGYRVRDGATGVSEAPADGAYPLEPIRSPNGEKAETQPHAPAMKESHRPWEVARWGRLLAGASILVFTGIGLIHHPLWHLGTLLGAINLVVTAFTGRCMVRRTLLRLGAKEREDLFLPGGAIRPQTPSIRLKKYTAARQGGSRHAQH